MGDSAFGPDDGRIASAVRSAVARYSESRSRSAAAEFDSEDRELLVELAQAVLAECGGQGTSRANNGETIDEVGPARTGDLDFTVTAKSPPSGPPRYKIVSKLGAGGMGVVYKAWDPELKRDVALKMVLAGGHASPQQLERFVAEARAVAKFDHPNLVRVFDIGEHEGLPYFAMEYVDGGALNQRIRKEPLDPKVAAKLMVAIAQGVHYAHTRKVIHRDLKPANVLLTADGTPKVTDFGLAKQLDEMSAGSATQTGLIMGTPSYMAPEQAEGKTKGTDERADIYALGATLYELLTGRPPFQAPNTAAILTMVRSAEPVPLRRLQPGVPRDLETICIKCLQKEPSRRYATAEALADDLKRFLNGEPINARPVGPAERFIRWCRRKPTLATLTLSSAALAVALVVSLAFYSVRIDRKNEDLNNKNADLDRKNADLLVKEEGWQRQAELSAEEVRYLINSVGGEFREHNLTKARQGLFQHVIGYLGRVDRISAESSGIAERGLVASHTQLGDICVDIAKADPPQGPKLWPQADAFYTRAIVAAREIVARDPDSDLARGNLALALNQSATSKIEQKKYADAEPLLTEAERLRADIIKNPRSPNGPNAIKQADAVDSLAATVYARFSVAFYQGLPEAADLLNRSNALYREALQLVEQHADVTIQPNGIAHFRLKLARQLLPSIGVAIRQKNIKLARERADEAMLLADQVLKEDPQNQVFRREFAEVLRAYAYAELLSKNFRAAAEKWDRALAEMNLIISETGPSPLKLQTVERIRYGLGVARFENGDKKEAGDHFRAVVTSRRAKFSAQPTAGNHLALIVAMARSGDIDGTQKELAAEQSRPTSDPSYDASNLRYLSASVYSILAEHVGNGQPDASLSEPDRTRRQELLAKAWENVEQLFVMKATGRLGDVETDFDLKFLQQRPDFAQRFEELRKKHPPKK